MGVYKEALDIVERGRMGLNVGLDMGLPSLATEVPGIQQGTIYTIGGVTGCGKSAFAMSSFVQHPYMDWKANKKDKIKLRIFVWSLEMNRAITMTKLICRNIYHDHHMLVDINYVLSRGKNRISDEIYRIVRSYVDYYEEFEDIVTIYGPESPSQIIETLEDHFQQNGQNHTKEFTYLDSYGRSITARRNDFYSPNHPNAYTIAIIDHVNILKGEYKENKKNAIDRLSGAFQEMANYYGLTPVYVQQINRSVEGSDRLYKYDASDILLSDFKESSDTQEDADVVIAINHPYRWGKENYRGYNISKLQDRCRFISVLKNRNDFANRMIPCLFLGEVGLFEEIPDAKYMTQTKYEAIAQIKSLKHYE